MNVQMPIYHGDQRTPLHIERMNQPGRMKPQVMPQVIDMRYRQPKNMGEMFIKHHMEKKRNMLPANINIV